VTRHERLCCRPCAFSDLTGCCKANLSGLFFSSVRDVIPKRERGISTTALEIPRGKQRRIVARIESLFAQAEAIERAVKAARRRAAKVDQAILARAFRGEL